MTPSKEQNKWR